MRKIASILISLALVLSFVPANASEVFQKTVNTRLPVLQKNYLCNANAEGIDLRCDLVAYYRFQEALWDGSRGEVKDVSGNSGVVRENGLADSDDFTGASWADVGTPFPVTATSIADNGATQEGCSATLGDPGTNAWVASIKMPKLGGAPAHYPALRISFSGGTTKSAGIVMDAFNGTAVAIVAGGVVAPDDFSAVAEDLGTEWRFYITSTPNADNTSNLFIVYPAVNTDGSADFLGATAGATTFGGSQYENSALPTAYVATTGTAILETGNHGQAVNGVTTIAGGKLGRSGSFNGINQYLSFGLTTMLDGAKAFTINIWVKADTIPFVGGIVSGQRGIFVRGGPNKRIPWIWGENATSYLRLQMTTTTGGVTDGAVITADLTQDTWHMATFTWDGTTLTPYLDNVAGTSDTTAGSILADADLEDRIGFLNGFGYWDGMIDEVAVWNRVLNANEIEQIYNAGRGRYIQ